MNATVALFIPHNGCPFRCSFCDQTAITGYTDQPQPEDVIRTAEQGLANLGDRAKTCELAFFGGSFTCVDRDYRISLLEAAQPFLGNRGFRGIRISTRPDAVDEDMLRLLKSYGVTTVELGVQSMCDAVLAENGRGHTSADVIDSAKRIREAGLSLGLQMMTGLPADTPARSRETAGKLIALKPDCVRIYPTVVLRGTLLADWVAAGRYTSPTLEDTVALCAELADAFEHAGIPVIRMGLHSIDPERYVAGPWHPAFGEMVESYRLYHRLRGRIPGPGHYLVTVNDRRVSALIGQHRSNLRRFEEEGIHLTLRPDPATDTRDMIVEEVKD